MFTIEPEKLEPMLAIARNFQSEGVKYHFSDLEISALRPFFSNLDGKTFFVFSLPSTIGTALLAMFSRMKNSRGVRGSWVDSFLPQMLAGEIREVVVKYALEPDDKNHEAKFLKERGITSLELFVSHSEECRQLFGEFVAKATGDPDYFRRFAESKRAKRFLDTWLDTYGHNSIARMGSLWLCCEQVSLLTAKSIEWSRPGTGYIELSTRYVNMGGKEIYPIVPMLEVGYGCDPRPIESLFATLFDDYRTLFGDKTDGILPTFYRQQYANTEFKDPGDLAIGVAGETSDVLGNLLPLATLTEVAIACNGEAFPGILKHLMLDGTPENLALIEVILKEAPKIGADSYARHWRPTQAEMNTWRYLHHDSTIWKVGSIRRNDVWLSDDYLSQDRMKPLFSALGAKEIGDRWDLFNQDDLTDLIADIQRERFYHDKLSNEFESVSATFFGLMSMRGWRDLHRMGMSTHRRTLVTPLLGFYEYDKPQPDDLGEAFARASEQSTLVYDLLNEVPAFLRQYLLPMGWRVGFRYGANLRQMEFSIWQRTKPSVNHEVRQIFLAMNAALYNAINWWQIVSRASFYGHHRQQKYIFARSKSETGTPLLD